MKRIPYVFVIIAAVMLLCGIVSADPSSPDSPVGGGGSSKSAQPAQPAQPGLDDVRKWTVSRMLRWSRPGRSFHPPAKETLEEGTLRYAEIADAVRDVIYDPIERPVFGGRYGRARTMALVLSISLYESGYRKDVDLNIGKLARGDGGKSWCLMQLQLGTPSLVHPDGRRAIDRNAPGVRESTPTRILLEGNGIRFTNDQTVGHGGPDLIADRRLCFRAGYRAIRRSFSSCRRLPMLERLSAYASGNCNDGREASRRRVGTAIRWINTERPPLSDKDVMALLKKTTTQPSPPDDKRSIASAMSPW